MGARQTIHIVVLQVPVYYVLSALTEPGSLEPKT